MSNSKPVIVDAPMLDALSAAARENPRRRLNHNLHGSYQDPFQRLLNALEPDSYVRPHRHLTPPKPETFLILRGRLAVVLFRDGGGIEQVVPLSPEGGALGVDVPSGVWHCVLALSPGSIFFEAKPGPYEPISDKDFAPWAPPEGSSGAADYLAGLLQQIRELIGQIPPG